MPDPSADDVLRALDKVLSDRPNKSGHDFSEATRCLTAWRERLAARWRQTGADADRRRLDRVNAAISVIAGGQFPLGDIPWPLIAQARQDMAALAEAALPDAHETAPQPGGTRPA